MNEEEKEHLRLVEKEIPYTSARDFGHLFNQQLQMLTLKQLNPHTDFVKVKSLSRVQLFAPPWTTQSMEFSRSECWSG